LVNRRILVSGSGYPSRLLVLISALAMGTVTARAQAQPSIVLGDGWALVREQRLLTFTNRTQGFVLDGIPAEADLATLNVYGRRVPLGFSGWHAAPIDAPPARAQLDPELLAGTNKGDIVWRPFADPVQDRPHDQRSLRLWCELEAPSTGERPVQVVYYMTGLTWSAHYSVLLRGDLEKEDERVSVEFDGAVRIVNRTRLQLAGAKVTLVGADRIPGAAATEEPGFLMLDEESPLSDLWRNPAETSSHRYEYVIPQDVDIPARGDATVSLATAARQPAERLYRLIADDLPATGRQKARPLRRHLVVKNSPQFGLGFALPPGQGQVFLGSTRSVLLQQAWFSHTPANGAIHVDLGIAEQVVASRKTLARENEALGTYLETYSLVIENGLDAPVRVDVDETPPTALAWDVVRARTSYAQRGRHLYFSTQLEPRSTDNIEYTIRVHEPTL
jgi:hypothetical protein